IPGKSFPVSVPCTCSSTTRQKICCAASHQALELVENVGIPPAFCDFLFHGLQRIGDGKSPLVRSIRGQGVVNIDDLQSTGSPRNILSSKPIRITRTIKFFVMMSNDRKHETKRFQGRADALAHYRMLLN